MSSFGDHPEVTGYLSGSLAWGTEPSASISGLAIPAGTLITGGIIVGVAAAAIIGTVVVVSKKRRL